MSPGTTNTKHIPITPEVRAHLASGGSAAEAIAMAVRTATEGGRHRLNEDLETRPLHPEKVAAALSAKASPALRPEVPSLSVADATPGLRRRMLGKLLNVGRFRR
jgi:hypothetical protein